MRSRVVMIAAVWSLGVLALPQGDGGFGGGGFGATGGFEGGRVVLTGSTDEVRTRLFLSPGDRTEWTFSANQDDAAIVTVTSGVFDPAVAILDDAGNVLAENDDLSPGNQMAQAVAVLPRTGKYRVVVTNYKGTAGGPFELAARSFRTVPLEYGVEAKFGTASNRTWARIRVEEPTEITLTVRNPKESLQIIQPNGEMWRETAPVYAAEAGTARFWLKIATPGTYFLWAGDARDRSLRANPISTFEGKPNAEWSGSLAGDDLHRWTVAVTPGTVLELSPAAGSGVAVELPFYEGPSSSSSTKVLGGSPTARYLVGTVGTGRIVFTVRHTTGQPGPYRIAVRTMGSPLPERGARAKLGWMDTGIWLTQVEPGNVLRITANSETYHPYVRVLCPGGRLVYSTPAQTPPEVGLSILSYIPGPYIVCVTGGGIGDYSLKQEVREPKRLTPATNAGLLGLDTPEVWRFELSRPLDCVFRLQREGVRCSVAVYAPDGSQVATIGEGDDFVRAKLERSGKYQVVVRPSDGSAGKYVLKWVSLD